MNLKDELFYCDECKVLGYCKKAKKGVESVLDEESFNARVNEDIAKQLDNILPIKSTANFGSRNAQHLQQAHNLLRLQDFESASTLYNDLIHDNYYHWELHLGMSLCCFYTEKYDEAASYANQIRIENNENWSLAIQQFIQLCISRKDSPALSSLGSQGPSLKKEVEIPNSFFTCNAL
ncbi:MAG: tetratricopeptide repeat protein [Opitutaceae bacterium]|nr:tetratricopeptide repeat protein [Cytophagales bacterium]